MPCRPCVRGIRTVYAALDYVRSWSGFTCLVLRILVIVGADIRDIDGPCLQNVLQSDAWMWWTKCITLIKEQENQVTLLVDMGMLKRAGSSLRNGNSSLHTLFENIFFLLT